MSSNERDSSVGSQETLSERQATSSDSDGGTSTSGLLCHVTSHNYAYDDEPLVEPGENTQVVEDPDGILPGTLEARSDGTITIEQWYVLFNIRVLVYVNVIC